jgi:hypothetical protein
MQGWRENNKPQEECNINEETPYLGIVEFTSDPKIC